jgi:hypothetical protein
MSGDAAAGSAPGLARLADAAGDGLLLQPAGQQSPFEFVKDVSRP